MCGLHNFVEEVTLLADSRGNSLDTVMACDAQAAELACVLAAADAQVFFFTPSRRPRLA